MTENKIDMRIFEIYWEELQRNRTVAYMKNKKNNINLDTIRKTQEETTEHLREKDKEEMNKLFSQHQDIIHNIENENNLETERILIKQHGDKILRLERSRQELESSITRDRQELEALLSDQAKFLRERKEQYNKEVNGLISKYESGIDQEENNLSEISTLRRNHSANINELRKHQLIELHKMRLRQFDNLQKRRREMSLSTGLAERSEEAEVYDLRINQEDKLEDTRIKQENEAQELRIKQDALLQEILLEQESDLSNIAKSAS